MANTAGLKRDVQEYWQEAPCGEGYLTAGSVATAGTNAERYRLEPYIEGFARFEDALGRDVIEIGVGLGLDHLRWAKAGPRRLIGVDLTTAAVEHTRARLMHHGAAGRLLIADAENLPFADASFDLVYSWGVLHHTPNTARAIGEAVRVLRAGGRIRLTVYHTRSLVGYMLWARYGLFRGRPGMSLTEAYARYLESPGTKAYSIEEAKEMVRGCRVMRVWTQLSFGDLLEGEVGQRHRGQCYGSPRRYGRAR